MSKDFLECSDADLDDSVLSDLATTGFESNEFSSSLVMYSIVLAGLANECDENVFATVVA